jgi:hypothetical protein
MQKLALVVLLLVLLAYASLFVSGQPIAELLGRSFSEIKENLEILKLITETLAIIVAGYWTYNRFIKERVDYPYPRIEHRIEHHDLRNGIIYVSVFVTFTNQGKSKLDLGKGTIYTRQVLPVPERIGMLLNKIITESGDELIRVGKASELFQDEGRRIGWDTLGFRESSGLAGKKRQLEPGQTREIQFDFLVEDGVEIIEVISSFEYTKSSWELATLYSLVPGANESII